MNGTEELSLYIVEVINFREEYHLRLKLELNKEINLNTCKYRHTVAIIKSRVVHSQFNSNSIELLIPLRFSVSLKNLFELLESKFGKFKFVILTTKLTETVNEFINYHGRQ